MEKDEYRYSAGLVFLEQKQVDTVELCNEIQEILETRGQRIMSVRAVGDDHTLISTDTLTVDLSAPLIANEGDAATVTENPDGILARAKMIIGLSVSVSKQTDSAETDAIQRQLKPYLAEITCQLALASRPCFVMWLRASAILETLEFIETAPLMMRPKPESSPQDKAPERERSTIAVSEHGAAWQFPKVYAGVPHAETRPRRQSPDLCFQMAGSEYQSETAASPPDNSAAVKSLNNGTDAEGTLALRMASWIMVTTVGLFSLPFAIVLCVINILRGEDFRLAAHTLALTGFAITLNATGAFAETITLLGL
ncbi:hypothetical protein [Thalassovita sp.]|uniref:hypothetical protein n=1 Tax=Thalassovita sp. TaxID=1979401 RepID=UPI002B265838|nr:hypothetical protein [Thalassovita sp.]